MHDGKITKTTLADERKLLDKRGRPIANGVGGHVKNGQPTWYRDYTLPAERTTVRFC